MIGKKYTDEYKFQKIRECLDRVENGEKISKADFSYENGISDSAFNDWVIKFNRMGKGFANVTEQITALSGNVQGELPKDMVRVIYNGITAEFNECLLDRVMGMVKT